MSACPYCFSEETSRSRGHWYERWRKLISSKRPYRCNSCLRRFWVVPTPHQFQKTTVPEERADQRKG